jgi:hypothetical protein
VAIATIRNSLIYSAILLSILSAITGAGLRDPFPPGFSMGTMGAVIDDRGATGREPWTSASFYGDSAGFGAALSGVSYYGSAGSVTGADGIGQVFGGGWLSIRKLIGKASIAYFSALDAYYEQTGFISAGTSALPYARLSIEARGYRFGARLPGNPSHTIGEIGVSAWVPWSWAAVSFQLDHLVLATARADGADPPLTLRCGIHTVNNRFGGQGALITISTNEPKPVCFTIGEEYRVTPAVAFHAALANNPLFISIGATFIVSRAGFDVSLVNHQQLGWSQGFSAEYRK